MDNRNSLNSDVLVIGAGIAGMQAALLLAEKDQHVYLMDSAPAIGGYFPLLDRTFPTNHCGRCFMSPKAPSYCPIYENDFHENISLLTCCSIDSLEGSAGSFTAHYTRKPQRVDEAACDLCGICESVCPVEADRQFGGGLERRKAIYLPFMQAIPRTYVVDEKNCTQCGACVEACPKEAVSFEAGPQHHDVDVGAIILGLGFDPLPADLNGEYGYGRYSNVLSSVQFERMLSTSGPTGGVPTRLSDGKPAQKVAFIQCVGSRDRARGREYCSSVCCRISTKQAIVAKEHVAGLDAALFYMDIRAMGKEYERYYEAASDRYGVRFVRSAVSTVRELQQSKDLQITYADSSGELRTEVFDAVVLAQGFDPPRGVAEAANRIGIDLNSFGFCVTSEFAPNQTTVPGIYAAGAFREPKDIPESIVDACSAASEAAVLLSTNNSTHKQSDGGRAGAERAGGTDGQTEIDLGPERFGIFICDQHDLLRQGLNIIHLVGELSLDKNIVIVRWIDFTDIESGLDEVKNLISEREVTRVIVAGYRCLQISKFIKKHTGILGTFSNLFSISDIGEQCANVHRGNKDLATEKALALIRAAQEAVRHVDPKQRGRKPLSSRVIVVGGGVAGLSAALDLAKLGFGVDLIEREGFLGGNAREIRYTIKGGDIKSYIGELIDTVEKHPEITVRTNTELRSVTGTWGNFSCEITSANGDPSEPEMIAGGALIFAVGGREIRPEEYLYGENQHVVTQRELEHGLDDESPEVRDAAVIAMIQCVSCRTPERPYCSRVCCIHAMKNIQKLLDADPDRTIYVLYRDIRTYGFYESYYREARDRGVVVVRYSPEDKPRVTPTDRGVRISFTDPLLGREISIDSDLLALSVGIEPAAASVADIAGLCVNQDGFFAEANPKSAPLDSVDRGKFFCGVCHSPNLIENVICQGKAAAARAATLLWGSSGEFSDFQAIVNERRCTGCGLCVAACPYGARVLDEISLKARVLEDLCKGCGTCAVSCPNGATRQYQFDQPSVMRMIDEVLR